MLKLFRITAAILVVLMTPACAGPSADTSQAIADGPDAAGRDAGATAGSNSSAESQDRAGVPGEVRLVADTSGRPRDAGALGIQRLDPTPTEPTAADLHLQDGQFAPNGFRLLSPAASTGRFPAGVAVARLRVELTPDNVRRLRFDPLLGREAARWNDFADDVPAVREIVFSGPLGLAPDSVDVGELIRAAVGLRCGLCLTYARCGDPIYDWRVFGVLWDSSTLEALATFDASAAVTPAEYERCLEDGLPDERLFRADDLAEFDFERQVLHALYELAKRDTRASSTQPNPWQTDRLLLPRDELRYYGPRLIDPRYWRK